MPGAGRRDAGAVARGPLDVEPERPPAARGSAGREGPVPSRVKAERRLPKPRLTGLGGGLFCGAAMLLLGYLGRLLSEASLTVYGVLFLLVSALTAVWVRQSDVVTAPIVVPIAFALGLLPVTESADGLTGHLVSLVTALATQAGWLYGGTLGAGVIATVRRLRPIKPRAAQRGATAPRPPSQAA